MPVFIRLAWQRLATPRWALPAWFLLFGGFWVLAWVVLEPLGLQRNDVTVSWAVAYTAVDIGLSSTVLAILASLRLQERFAGESGVSPATFFQKSFASAEDEDLIELLKSKLAEAKSIKLVALGLAVLDRETLLHTLIEKAANGAEVVICAGNPFSPRVIDRWIEESQYEAPRGQTALEDRLRRYLRYLDDAHNPRSFQLLLFDSYPTLATYIIDDEIFVFPYTYEVRGNFSPMLHFRVDDSAEAKFFKESAERIISQATPANDVLRARYQSAGLVRETWNGLAVFILPEAGSAFERLGQEALGYDPKSGRYYKPQSAAAELLQKNAGQARALGFHMTVVDRLLFPTRPSTADGSSGERVFSSSGRRAMAEVRYVASLCTEFRLTKFSLDDNFRGNQLVLRCVDESGSLEVLHTELTTRVNPLALSSSYRAGLANNPLPSNLERADKMVRHYGAPYVLSQFEPHFTLCPKLPANAAERSRVVRAAEKLLSEIKLPSEMTVCDLAMVGGQLEGQWKVRDAGLVPLGRAFPREGMS